MIKKFFIISFMLLGASFFVATKAYASLDISLQDSPAEEVVRVLVDSNAEEVIGFDIAIAHSADIQIDEVSLNDEYCSFLSEGTFSQEDNRVSIVCLGSDFFVASDVLAEISYTTDSVDYFFYVDERFLDIGEIALGNVTNVNFGEEKELEKLATVEDEEVEATFLDTSLEFLTDNYLYVLAGIMFVVAIVMVVIMLIKKDGQTEQEGVLE